MTTEIKSPASSGIPRVSRLLLIFMLALAVGGGGCSLFRDDERVPGQQLGGSLLPSAQQRARTRPPVNTSRNKYEGSLWRGAASWGNLLRDHRARYRGDLLTVSDMAKIIKVPDIAKEQIQAEQVAEEEQPTEAIDPVLAFLKLQEDRRLAIEIEQNDILRSIDTIEVQVVRVLSNGNLVVQGVHPPIFRDQNRVKYVVSLKGIVQPSDVDNNNTIIAPKLSRAEYRIRRLVKRSTIPGGDIARAAGRSKEGALFDRITNFISGPGTGSRNTRVSSK